MNGLDYIIEWVSQYLTTKRRLLLLNIYVTDGRVSTSVEPSQRPNPSSEDLHTKCLQKKKIEIQSLQLFVSNENKIHQSQSSRTC